MDKDDPPSLMIGEGGGVVYLAVFNWADAARNMAISGLGKGELDAYPAGKSLAIQEGGVQLNMAPRSSLIRIYRGDGDYASLRRDLAIR